MDRDLLKLKSLCFLSGLGFGVTIFSMVMLFRENLLTVEMNAILMTISAVVGVVGWMYSRDIYEI